MIDYRLELRDHAQKFAGVCKKALEELERLQKNHNRSSWSLPFKAKFPALWKQLVEIKHKSVGGRKSLSAIELRCALTEALPKCPECGGGGMSMFTVFGRYEFCSKRCSGVSLIARGRREAGNLAMHGSRNFFGSEEFKANAKKIYQDSLGYSNPSKSPDVKRTKAETFLDNWGESHFMKTIEGKALHQAAVVSRYGETNVMKVDSVRKTLAGTNLQRYGYASALSNKDVQELCRQTCLENNGKRNPFEGGLSEESQAKRVASIRRNCLEAHGVDWPTLKSGNTSRRFRRYSIELSRGVIRDLQGYEPEVALELDSDTKVVYVNNCKSHKVVIPYKRNAESAKVSSYHPDLVFKNKSGECFVVEVKCERYLLGKEEFRALNYLKFKAAEGRCKISGVTFLLAVHYRGVGTVWVDTPSRLIKNSRSASRNLDRLKKLTFG